MKKILQIIIALVVILILILAGYFVYSKIKGNGSPEEDLEEHAQETTSSKEKTNNILLVVGSSNYNDEEYEDTRQALEDGGYTVTVASKGVTTATGMSGGSIRVDVDIVDAKISDYDAIAFIGGPGAHTYFEDNDALNLVQEFYDAGKVTAALCSAPTILANAGLLEGRQATCFPGYEDSLIEKGAIHTGDSVTRDGLIITGNGPGASKEFGETIVDTLR